MRICSCGATSQKIVADFKLGTAEKIAIVEMQVEQHFFKKVAGLKLRTAGKIALADMLILCCGAASLENVADMQLRKSFFQVAENCECGRAYPPLTKLSRGQEFVHITK
jgi:hypothetical protein